MPKCRPLQLNITYGCPICPYHGTALTWNLICSFRIPGQTGDFPGLRDSNQLRHFCSADRGHSQTQASSPPSLADHQLRRCPVDSGGENSCLHFTRGPSGLLQSHFQRTRTRRRFLGSNSLMGLPNAISVLPLFLVRHLQSVQTNGQKGENKNDTVKPSRTAVTEC